MTLNSVLYGEVTVMNAITAVVIVFATVLIGKGIMIYLRRALKDRAREDQIGTFNKVIFYGMIVVALVMAMSLLGVNLSGLMVAGGIVGIVIGFASQSIVGNLVSGIFLLVERPIKIGDQVLIDNTMGFVEDIHIVSTTIRQYDGLFVRIPNEKVFTTNITNFVTHIVRRFEYVVGIRYSDDATEAIKIINGIIADHPLALVNPAPQAFVDNLGDNSVNIIVRIWSPIQMWYTVKMELLWTIKSTLEENGIEIAFPQRVIWHGDSDDARREETGAAQDAPGDTDK